MDIFKIFVELTFYLAEGNMQPKEYNVSYRATFTIRGNNYTGEIEFVEKFRITQGDAHIKANIIFPFRNIIYQNVSIGDKFTFCEGSKTLGEGIILKIYDPT